MRLAPNIDFLPNIESDFHLGADIVLPDFSPNPSTDVECLWHTLDVTRALKFYLHSTPFPNRDSQLFVSYAPRTLGKAVSAQRLSHWLVDLIHLCYAPSRIAPPSSVTAHFTRSVATSVAFAAGVPLQDICTTETWKNPITFIHHYTLDVQAMRPGTLSRTVLCSGLRVPPAPATRYSIAC